MKRWHGSDQRERWVGLGLLVEEKQFRPAEELEALAPSKSAVVKQRKVSYSGSQGSRYFRRNSGHSPPAFYCICFIAATTSGQLA